MCSGRTARTVLGVAAISLAAATLAACAILPGSSGSAAEARFHLGNEAYEEGDFQRAVEIYEGLAEEGIEAAALHYNLGNAYFKQNRLGPAILQYERALRLAPGDEDVRDNLEYCRSLTVDRITPASTPLKALGITMVLGLTSAGQDAAILVIFWVLAGAALALFILSSREPVRRYAVYAAVICALPAAAAGASLATKAYLERTRTEAILMEPQVDVLSGAGEDNPVLFTIHEGLKVLVRSRANGWALITLEDGLTGWVRESTLARI